MVILYQIDAFTDQPFRGNPAAVCLLGAFEDDAWMQQIASEMNLSETAFLAPHAAVGHYDLRWFTPAEEVDLCGHATLASAHFLWERGGVAEDQALTFHTRSGPLHAQQQDGAIAMDFPAEPPEAVDPPAELVEALGTVPTYIGQNRMDYLVALPLAQDVRSLTPDLSRLARLGTRGVIVTAQGDTDGVDFVSRFFAPAFGVPEDPVTGSAHCCLGPYWQQRLGKDALVGYQASARGGTVGVRISGDRVELRGQAVTVMKVELLVGAGEGVKGGN